MYAANDAKGNENDKIWTGQKAGEGAHVVKEEDIVNEMERAAASTLIEDIRTAMIKPGLLLS